MLQVEVYFHFLAGLQEKCEAVSHDYLISRFSIHNKCQKRIDNAHQKAMNPENPLNDVDNRRNWRDRTPTSEGGTLRSETDPKHPKNVTKMENLKMEQAKMEAAKRLEEEEVKRLKEEEVKRLKEQAAELMLT